MACLRCCFAPETAQSDREPAATTHSSSVVVVHKGPESPRAQKVCANAATPPAIKTVQVSKPAPPPVKTKAPLDEPKEEDDVVTPLQRGHHHKQRSSGDVAARHFVSLDPSWQPDTAGTQQQAQPGSAAGQGGTMTICSTFSITATMATMAASPSRQVVTAADILTGAVATQGLLRTPHTPLAPWLSGIATYTTAGGPPHAAHSTGKTAGSSPATPTSNTLPNYGGLQAYQAMFGPDASSPRSATGSVHHHRHMSAHSLTGVSVYEGSPSVSSSRSTSITTPTSRPPRPSLGATVQAPPQAPCMSQGVTTNTADATSAGVQRSQAQDNSCHSSRQQAPTTMANATARPAAKAQSSQSSHHSAQAAPVTNPYGFAQLLSAHSGRSRGASSGVSGYTPTSGHKPSQGNSGSRGQGAGVVRGGLQQLDRSGRGLVGNSRVPKHGSASSRMALSGLLSRGQSSTMSTDRKSTVSLDFRPRWR